MAKRWSRATSESAALNYGTTSHADVTPLPVVSNLEFAIWNHSQVARVAHTSRRFLSGGMRHPPCHLALSFDYFHSHVFSAVFPLASTSNSNTAATVFRRASFGDAVL